MGYYNDKDKFHVAVDCIIFGFSENELKLLLLQRNFEPAKGQWSLMGGFTRPQESIDQAAERVLQELTGLEGVYMEQLGAFGRVDRDPGERVISVAYVALIKIGDHDLDLLEKYNARWMSMDALPELVFDHDEMVGKALKRLKRRASTGPIGFNLLPPWFTLPQLQSLYEAIWQEKLDKRNFRKKILSLGVLERSSVKDMSSSRKGAYYYKFNKEKYDELSSSGMLFEL